jgi:hypothetical protein
LLTVLADVPDTRVPLIMRFRQVETGSLPVNKITTGIFSGMKSYPSADEVLDDLGEKVVEAFSRAVARARADLAKYREVFPVWVAESSERGLAAFIHDRMWQHLTVLVEDIADVRVIDKEPIRELVVHDRYRLRAKRHGEDGQVSTYPTQTAIEFLWQQDMLDGFDEEINLIVGYVWEAELREMGRPVLSLRAEDEIKWMHDLPVLGAGRGYTSITPIVQPKVEPQTPRIELPGVEEKPETESRGDGQ